MLTRNLVTLRCDLNGLSNPLSRYLATIQKKHFDNRRHSFRHWKESLRLATVCLTVCGVEQ